MKLYNKDFKRIMSAYKAVKTVLKSTNTNVTLFKGFALVDSTDMENIQVPNPQIVIDLDNEGTFQNAINLDQPTCDLLVKCKTDDDVDIGEKILIGKRELSYRSFGTLQSVVSTDNFIETFSCLASMFKLALKGVSLCRAKDDVRPVLQDILLENSKLVGVDGFRIFTRDVEGTTDHKPILLKKHTVDLLLKVLPNKGDDILKIYLGQNNQCSISFGDYTIYDTVDNKEYMKWQAAFSSDFEYELTVDRKKLLDALGFAISTSLEKKTIVKFTLKTGTLAVGQDELEVEYSKHEGAPGVHFKELLIAFNPKYFVDSIKDLKDERVTLRFISALTPCVIEHSKGKDLILPIRLKD